MHKRPKSPVIVTLAALSVFSSSCWYRHPPLVFSPPPPRTRPPVPAARPAPQLPLPPEIAEDAENIPPDVPVSIPELAPPAQPPKPPQKKSAATAPPKPDTPAHP